MLLFIAFCIWIQPNDHPPPPLNPIRRFGDVYYCEFGMNLNEERLKSDIKETGGPAYPTSHSSNYPNEIVGGMTLRDYFAKAAMQARLSDYESCKSIVEECQRTGISFAKNVAAQSYDMADAMLAERVK